jgi:hypothetical protein
VMSNSRPRRFPVTVTHPLVTRRQICHRTVADRPGNLSEVLTGHYRRAHPASVPGSRPRNPSAPSADAPTGLPTRDQLAAGHDRRTPAVTERGRSMVTANTKNRLICMHCKAADGSNTADQTRVIMCGQARGRHG